MQEEQKLIDFGPADNFSQDLKFRVLCEDSSPDFKFLFLPSNKEKLYGAKKTLLNIVRKPDVYVPADLNVSVSKLNDLVDLEKQEQPIEDEEEMILMRHLFGKKKSEEILSNLNTYNPHN